ncbi:MAG TPA: hypothetical protein VFQ44_21765 [Streptosporangiaceae bacterium]|nr:hypothetical protein [Streptosporangiaceae bacterium]
MTGHSALARPLARAADPVRAAIGGLMPGSSPAGGSALLRNGYALMANTVVTGVLGLAYWLLAARHYHPADVGRASAAYAAMNLLAGITAFSLIGAMARFIPQSGRATGRLVRLGYGVSVLSAVAGSVVFLSVTGRPGSSYSELTGVTAGIIFTGAVIIWSLFTLQDGVLVGLRNANWVTLENGLFGLAKIGLLLPLATLIPHAGIYISWIVPAALAVPLVNWLIFRKLLPGHARKTGNARPPGRSQIGRFLAGDVPGALLLLATISLVPVLVAMFVAPGSNAYFYIPWTIGCTLDLLSVSMALSLTVEGAFDPVKLASHAKAALRRMLIIGVPVALAAALLAPWLLGLFGAGYASEGAPILVLLAAATVPRTLTEIYLGALRAQNRTSRVALVQGLRTALVLGLTLVLTRYLGIIGAGIGVLISQVVVAIAVLPGLLGVLRADRRTGRASRPARFGPRQAREPAPVPAGRLPAEADGREIEVRNRCRGDAA